MTRREWMTSVAAAGLAATAAPAASRREEKDPFHGRIIDAHAHIWSADIKKYPLAPGFTKDDMWYFSYSAEELLSHALPAGIGRINLIQMTWYASDHAYILDIIKRYPGRFVGTGVIPAVTDIEGPQPDEAMVALSEGGIYAFRVRGKSTRPVEISDGERWLDHEGYHKMFQAGAEHHLAVSFLHTPSDLPEIGRMCILYPETPVILDHFSIVRMKEGRFIEEEVQALLGMAKHKQVMVKLGAFYGLGKKTPPYTDMLPLIRRVVDAFGPERCMWESDAPKQDKDGHTFRAANDVIRKHADFLSKSDKEKILIKTAENFFFKR